MVIVKDAYKETCCIIKYCCKTRLTLQCQYLPDEIWLEILSKLPLKSLLVCSSVCKSWRVIACYLKNKIESLPVCGLLFRTSKFVEGKVNISYMSLRTKEIGMQNELPTHLVVSSGYDNGLLANLSFDFGALDVQSPLQPDGLGVFFAVHKGLLLVVHDDCTYHVHNPFTKQAFALPKSPTVESCTLPDPHDKRGFIINLGKSPDSQSCHFLVIRLCRVRGVMEFYSSYHRKWGVKKYIMNNPGVKEAHWFMANYVFLPTLRILYFLTTGNRGLAIYFNKVYRARSRVATVRLPRVVRKQYRNTTLGECGGFLCLSYYSVDGFRIWKHDGRYLTKESDAWVPLLEICKFGPLCKSIGQKHLLNVIESGDSLIPWAFHPDDTVIFLCIKSCIFSYDLTDDTLHKVVELNDHEFMTYPAASPYAPCLASLEF